MCRIDSIRPAFISYRNKTPMLSTNLFVCSCGDIALCRTQLAGKILCPVKKDDACHRGSGEIVAFVWGRRDLKTAKELKKNFPLKEASHGMEYFFGRSLFFCGLCRSVTEVP
jgi:hypothetical protein